MAIKTYWDAVQIREGKPAYNIEMEEQGNWESFLPNQQFNEILIKAIGAVRNNDMDKHRSLWIEGTYGTGKSHAGAVLKHLLCDNVEVIRQWVEEEYRDPQYDLLRKQIFGLREKKRLLPITLVGQCGISNKEDLALVLQTRIQKALLSNGIELDIRTDYDNYIQHIEHNANFWDLTIAADGELSSIAPDRKRLVKLLRDCDSATLRTAKDACRRQGLSVRLRQENLSRWFFEVQDLLREKTAYNGLLVVWDEFTDVVKSELGISILVELQLLAEEAMNAKNDSYFLFISHPSALDRLSAQERTKTVGRYHYMHYNMEPVSAFKIMSRKFRQIVPLTEITASATFYFEAKDLYSQLAQTSNQPAETEKDLKKLFPLHPATANLATYYAREVGSSSRSVFDFLASDPVREFLNDPKVFKQGETITVDYLWDYIMPEMQQNVSKFGVVNERFNSYQKTVEHQGEATMRVFKGILLLNAFNNIANTETVTPSEENIANLFLGTTVEPQLNEILGWLNEAGVIQRSPSGLYEIRFSALPLAEVNGIKENLKLTEFRYTYNILRASNTARTVIEKKLANVARPYWLELFSLDANEYTLLSSVERTAKKALGYELMLTMFFARNADELTELRDIAERASKAEDGRFKDIVFLVMDKTLGNSEYERYIEYQANAQCAQRHGFADQTKSHGDNADKMVKEWVESAMKGIVYVYINNAPATTSPLSIDAGRITSFINSSIAPMIFPAGPEGLELIRLKSSTTYWKKQFVKATVEAVLQFNTKQEVCDRCKGPAMHMNFLLQDSVDENLQFKDDLDANHPLYKVYKFVKSKIDHADKSANFNLSYHLEALTKPPYGLFPSHSGMGMVAFALRPYIGKIFDLNGKPRTAKHLVEDVIELFKVWDGSGNRNKLDFKFQTKEEGQLAKQFISLFKLNTLKDYHDVSSLTDARWALTHAYLKEKGAPLWGLKYCKAMPNNAMQNSLCQIVDNLLRICEPDGMKNPALMTETLDLVKSYDFEFRSLLTVTDKQNNFIDGYERFLFSQEKVGLKPNELDTAKLYIQQNMQAEVGLWTEADVAEKLKDWRLSQMASTNIPSQNVIRIVDKIDLNDKKTAADESTAYGSQIKVAMARGRVEKINNLTEAKRLLQKLTELGIDDVLEVLIND
jgi:hypothetical protein